MTTSDLNGKITEISQAYIEFTGYKREDVIGKNHSIFRNHDLDKSVIKHLWDTLHNDNIWKGELKNNKFSGEAYWIDTIITPLYDINNVKIGYASIKNDITDKKRLKELSIQDPLTLIHNRRYFDSYFKRELNRSGWKKEKFALLLLGIDYYVEYKDLHGRIVAEKALLQISDALKESLSSKTYELFKVTEAEFAIILLNYDDSYIKNLSEQLLSSVEDLKIQNTQSTISDYFTISIGGINVATDVHNLYSSDIYNITDENLSKAKNQGRNSAVLELDENHIKNIQNIDLLTKLPNRSALIHDIEILQEEAMLIIVHMNQINMLKNIYGFDFTKKITMTKAQELQNIIRDEEVFLYSLNLKEFAILVTKENLFDKYLLLLQHSILVNTNYYSHNLDDTIDTDFTAGIAYGVSHLFNHADSVLQEAILSKIQYKIFESNQSTTQFQEDTLRRLQVYKNALHEGNIIPYFQPIIDAKTEKIMNYEALARLETSEGEIISPYYFLDSAKEDKSFEYFTRQMMQKVFNIYALNDIKISINISYENINSETMVDYIKNRLNKYGGDGVTFEILESEEMTNYTVLKNFIQIVKNYGCKVSIDDFGSGYSNFTNILQLDIDYIKLDGSLVEKLNTDVNIRNMISGLLTYSKNAKIETIAEFVSSQELATTVKELGVDYMQGYFYGEPKPPSEYGLKTEYVRN